MRIKRDKVSSKVLIMMLSNCIQKLYICVRI